MKTDLVKKLMYVNFNYSLKVILLTYLIFKQKENEQFSSGSSIVMVAVMEMVFL